MTEETRCSFDWRRSVTAVTRCQLTLVVSVSCHPRLSLRYWSKAFPMAVRSARSARGSHPLLMSPLICASGNATVTQRKPRLRRARCRRMRRADAELARSSSTGDATSIPTPRAILHGPTRWSNIKYQGRTTVGTASQDASRRPPRWHGAWKPQTSSSDLRKGGASILQFPAALDQARRRVRNQKII
jgi:hypothetical protein